MLILSKHNNSVAEALQKNSYIDCTVQYNDHIIKNPQ